MAFLALKLWFLVHLFNFLPCVLWCFKIGSYVPNATKGKRERVGHILQYIPTLHSESEVYAGDPLCCSFERHNYWGRVCDEKNLVILKSMEFPEPVIQVAIEPKSKAHQDKMGVALQKLI